MIVCYTINVKGQEIKVPKGSLGFGYSVTKKLFQKILKNPLTNSTQCAIITMSRGNGTRLKFAEPAKIRHVCVMYRKQKNRMPNTLKKNCGFFQ